MLSGKWRPFYLGLNVLKKIAHLICSFHCNWLHVDLCAAFLQEALKGYITVAKRLVPTTQVHLEPVKGGTEGGVLSFKSQYDMIQGNKIFIYLFIY